MHTLLLQPLEEAESYQKDDWEGLGQVLWHRAAKLCHLEVLTCTGSWGDSLQ